MLVWFAVCIVKMLSTCHLGWILSLLPGHIMNYMLKCLTGWLSLWLDLGSCMVHESLINCFLANCCPEVYEGNAPDHGGIPKGHEKKIQRFECDIKRKNVLMCTWLALFSLALFLWDSMSDLPSSSPRRIWSFKCLSPLQVIMNAQSLDRNLPCRHSSQTQVLYFTSKTALLPLNHA